MGFWGLAGLAVGRDSTALVCSPRGATILYVVLKGGPLGRSDADAVTGGLYPLTSPALILALATFREVSVLLLQLVTVNLWPDSSSPTR